MPTENGRSTPATAQGAGLRHSLCPVCGGGRLSELSGRLGFPVVRCADCTIEFLNPQPDDATLAGIYSTHYFLGEPTPEGEERMQTMKRATAALYVNRLAGALGQGGQGGGAGGRLLEVGCGRGEFLLEAQARGFDVSGVEFSPDATAVANRRLGADKVQAGTIEQAGLAEGSFDAVVFADVLEHVREPLAFLKRVHALLKPGGTVLLVTPAADSFSAKLLRRYWMEYKVEHLYYFTRHACRAALEKSGFRNIVITANTKVLSLDYVYYHFQRFPVPVFTALLKVLRALAPERLAHRHWQVSASGMMVTARK